MPTFERIHNSFSQQGLMTTLGAVLDLVENGIVIISVPFRETLTQQHGYFHAGVMTSIADVACGYAALTTATEDQEVLSVEFKINFLKPAKGNRLIAVGKVIQTGKTLVICEGTVYNETQEIVIAKMITTMILVKAG